jgi:hypothetical protein
MTDPLESRAAAGRSVLVQDIRLPAFETLNSAGRRRRIRGRLLVVAAVAAVAAVALVLTGGVTILQPAPIAPDGGSPVRGPIVAKPATATASSAACMFFPVTDQVIFFFFYQDKPCDVDESGVRYAVTTDGGQSWRLYVPPSDDGSCAGLMVIGPHDVLMCGYVSHDNGATWADQPGQAADVEAVPAGWRLFVPDNGKMTAVNPRTGQFAQLANQPDSAAVPPPVLAPDGSLWVVNHIHGDFGPVRISRDRGRTWFRARMPSPFQESIASMTTGDGRTGYAIADDGHSGTALLRTTDGGVTWSIVKRHDTTIGGALLPGPNGSVLAPGSNTTLISTDGAATFRPVPGIPGTPERNPNGTYSIEGGMIGGAHIWVASSSLHFAKITAPPGIH